jgi:hypothetical protein
MKNYILSIDGNYDTDFEAEFYFNSLNKFYSDKNLQITKFYISSSDNTKCIVEKLNKIKVLCDGKNNFVLLVGGIAEPIVKDLNSNLNIFEVFEQYEEVSRVYRQIEQRNSLINILLIDKTKNNDLIEGFQKIDSLNMSIGFNFKIVDVTDQKLMETYKQIVEIIKENGWEVPPIEN